jgi:hypothetical protein
MQRACINIPANKEIKVVILGIWNLDRKIMKLKRKGNIKIPGKIQCCRKPDY